MDILPAAPAHEPRTQTDERVAARQRLQVRRDFTRHLAAFVVVNGFFIGIWAMTGAGYFWPAWVLGCWGIGLALHAWETFLDRPITDKDIDDEVARQR
jgi:hypothetical protein